MRSARLIALALAGQVLAGAALAGAAPAAAGEVRVAARRDGDAVLFEAQAELRADPALIWAVLTDYADYARFVPDLQSSRVLARTGNEVRIAQRGTAGFFLFRFPLEVELAVTEEPPDRVSSRLLSGNFREMTGLYRLTAAGEGMLFSYQGRLVPAFALPPVVGLPAVRASVARQFGALVREIERRVAQRDAVPR